ncbi:hypothetical protein GQX73_g10082 [Xylaria multiplex]|uniref:Uncharacterized protein n=1 Tax=Xylaria multiplex TaxID=323545 RepID=A0A7C8IH12_9PEZI|nr:hypothetical protein GQX73_g10082 [Xylaria multiplex]
MSLGQKKEILARMAGLLKALQDYPLPASIKGWGGVTFDDSGAIVSASMPSVALDKADVNPHLQGWRANGVRECVDAFIERGLAAELSNLKSKQDRSIVHADFSEYLFIFVEDCLLVL